MKLNLFINTFKSSKAITEFDPNEYLMFMDYKFQSKIRKAFYFRFIAKINKIFIDSKFNQK